MRRRRTRSACWPWSPVRTWSRPRTPTDATDGGASPGAPPTTGWSPPSIRSPGTCTRPAAISRTASRLTWPSSPRPGYTPRSPSPLAPDASTTRPPSAGASAPSGHSASSVTSGRTPSQRPYSAVAAAWADGGSGLRPAAPAAPAQLAPARRLVDRKIAEDHLEPRTVTPHARSPTPRRGTRPERPVAAVAADLNPVLRGWGAYFRNGNSGRKFNAVDGYGLPVCAPVSGSASGGSSSQVTGRAGSGS